MIAEVSNNNLYVIAVVAKCVLVLVKFIKFQMWVVKCHIWCRVINIMWVYNLGTLSLRCSFGTVGTLYVQREGNALVF